MRSVEGWLNLICIWLLDIPQVNCTTRSTWSVLPTEKVRPRFWQFHVMTVQPLIGGGGPCGIPKAVLPR